LSDPQNFSSPTESAVSLVKEYEECKELPTSDSHVTREPPPPLKTFPSGQPNDRTPEQEPQGMLLRIGCPASSPVIQHPLKHRIPPGPVVVPRRNDLLIRPDDILAGLDELIELHRVADCPV
jgi:hypothetical protein